MVNDTGIKEIEEIRDDSLCGLVENDSMIKEQAPVPLDNLEEILGEGDSEVAQVMIVDDCPFNIEAMQGNLELFNVKNDFCYNGNDAIEKV